MRLLSKKLGDYEAASIWKMVNNICHVIVDDEAFVKKRSRNTSGTAKTFCESPAFRFRAILFIVFFPPHLTACHCRIFRELWMGP